MEDLDDDISRFMNIAALATEDFTEQCLERLQILTEVLKCAQKLHATDERARLLSHVEEYTALVRRVPDIVDKAALLRDIDEATEGLSL